MKTESMEKSANEPGLSGTEVSTGLAPFEEESTILIDEYPLVGPFMLEEFERSNEIIEINELFGHSAQEESGSPDESAPEEIDNGEREKTDTEGDKATGVPPTPERVGSPFDEEGPIAGEPHSALPPLSPVVGFVCEHAVDIEKTINDKNCLIGTEIVHLIKVPCAGMVKPEWIKLALERGASGVAIIACDPLMCHHRTGSRIIGERLEKKRRPMLLSSIDRERIKLFQHHRGARNELMENLGRFLSHLGAMDAGITKEEPVEEEIIEESM